MSPPDYAVVVPTIGRASLAPLLRALGSGPGPLPREVIVVNDRPAQALDVPSVPGLRLSVIAGAGHGPATARNRGWRATGAQWIAFLDDDVLPDPGWRAALAGDLAVGARVGAVAGRIQVPGPSSGRPTDWQRQVMGLAEAPWITADIAYRRAALQAVHGFHEGFTSAFREDTDLGVRVRAAGFDMVRGQRRTTHPIPDSAWWVSIARQSGNADDALLRRRYGRDWHEVTGVPRGRRARHLLTTAAALVAAGTVLAGRRTTSATAATLWLGLTAELAARRILPGPRTPTEVLTMAVTSPVIPPAATLHWLRGCWLHRRAARVALPAHGGGATW
jgi:glycosyltransferase involved in cell wall biosynthesis